MNYYNEYDPKAAAWLQQLIEDKQIPQGHVDSRSILEVQPSDLSGFTQCHFFAGIGGWSLALQLAGWPIDRPVWTASLPCQPFSAAGKQRGTDDERHLAPVFLELVRQCRPPVCFGEQVASKLARTDWFPGIRLELEALGYAVGAADLCAPLAGEICEGRIVRGDQESWGRVIIGQPHIRQRLYWVAQSHYHGTGSISGKASGCERSFMDAGAESLRQAHGTTSPSGVVPRSAGGIDGLADASSEGLQGHRGLGEEQVQERRDGEGGYSPSDSMELLPSRDGKTRRTQSGIFPLVDGLPRGVVPSGDPDDPSYCNATAEARAVRLKGYGNAIVPPLAALFLRSTMEATQP